MSAKVAMRVLESDLPAHLKLTAAVLALLGDDNGERIFPSVEYLGFLISASPRSVRRVLAELRSCGVLVPQRGLHGGRTSSGAGRTTRYWLNANALPVRPRWRSRKPDTDDRVNPDTDGRVCNADLDQRTRSPATATLPPMTATLTPVAANPDTSDSRSVSDPLERSVSTIGEQRADARPRGPDANRLLEVLEGDYPTLAATLRRRRQGRRVS